MTNYVQDVPEHYVLITDQREIEQIGLAIGADILSEFGGLFVEVQDGDYGYIYGFEGSVPFLHKRVWDIDIYLESGRWLQEIGQ